MSFDCTGYDYQRFNYLGEWHSPSIIFGWAQWTRLALHDGNGGRQNSVIAFAVLLIVPLRCRREPPKPFFLLGM